MKPKSLKIWWGADVSGSGGVLRFLFGNRGEIVAAAESVIARMKKTETLSITRYEMRQFAIDLQSGRSGIKYSCHNFYTKLLRKLIDLGLVEKCVIWGPKRRKTVRVYQLKLQPVTERAPSSGFAKRTWQVAKAWNNLVES